MSSTSTEIPIAETFVSIQGEGVFTGTKMLFIRTAGCNVGNYAGAESNIVKYENLAFRDTPAFTETINNKYAVCCNMFGAPFVCDTDYHKTSTINAAEISFMLMANNIQHICLTGGEPTLHAAKLVALLEELETLLGGIPPVHLETSGTLYSEEIELFLEYVYWTTCSPKQGFREEWRNLIDAWKFVVTSPGQLTQVKAALREEYYCNVYISPDNGIFELNKQLAEELLKSSNWEPHWRLNTQVHKVYGWR